MLNLVERAIATVAAMTEGERADFVAHCQAEGWLPKPCAAEEPTGDIAKRGGRGRKGGGYWMKTITGWREDQKGAYRAKGDFVNQVSELSAGDKVLVGWTDEEHRKTYALGVVGGIRKEVLTLVGGGTKEIEGISLSFTAHGWADFERQAKALGVGK